MSNMTLQDLIWVAQKRANQNIWQDMFDNSDWIFEMYDALSYVYNYVNKFWWLFWTIADENLVPENWIVTLSYPMNRLIAVMNSEEAELIPANYYLLSNDTQSYIIKSEKTIQVTSDITSVRVVYLRGIDILTTDDVSLPVDIPNALLWVVVFYTLWKMMPIYLEQWASLANNFFSQMKEILDEYMFNLWYTQEQSQLKYWK